MIDDTAAAATLTDTDDGMLTPILAAVRLGRSQSWVYRQVKAGSFDGVVEHPAPVGIRIPVASVDAYAAAVAERKAARAEAHARALQVSDEVIEECARRTLAEMIESGKLPEDPGPAVRNRVARVIRTVAL